MPQIGKSFSATQKLYMPSTEGAKKEEQGWVTVRKDLSMEKIIEITKIEISEDEKDVKKVENNLLLLIKIYAEDLFVDWNYEIDNKKAEITEINIAKALSQRDLRYIQVKTQEEADKIKMSTAEKKN